LSGALKRCLRAAADQTARAFGALALREHERSLGLTILTYHRVLPESRCVDYPFPALAMPLGAFRAQLHWLARNGEVLPLSQALDFCAGSRERPPGPRPLIALTFDDGYDDASDHIAPELEAAGLRGTFFISTGFVGTDELLWFDQAALLFGVLGHAVRRDIVSQLAPSLGDGGMPAQGADGASWTRLLKRCTPAERQSVLLALARAAGGMPVSSDFRGLSVGALVGLHERGHEIGSHTVTHPLLPQLGESELRREVENSKRALEDWLGAPVRGFCYPNGDGDPRVAAAVASAGYQYACTTRDGVLRRGDDLYRVPRIDVVPDRVAGVSSAFTATAFRRELCNLYRRRD
jgi:peptidoglycan/xylan/chitin deacetylase (PgdA/CDA1 family)